MPATSDNSPPGTSPHQLPRRTFLAFCATVAGVLALPVAEATRVAAALQGVRRFPVVWLATQDCTADTESFLRSADPDVLSVLFDVISLDYHETLMVAAGASSHTALAAAMASPDGFVCVVEGAIPQAEGGIYCTIGGRTALSLVREVTAKASLTLAVGACAVDGGIAAAAPNPTGATGVAGAVPGITNLVNLPGCPANGINIVATIVAYLTDRTLPALDSARRPLFAYQQKVHGKGRCERFPNLVAGRTVSAWGDEAHRTGGCLLHMGCRGPSTFANCYQRNWNETTWPVGAGAPCIGCTTPGFWDANTPFYVYHDTRPTTSPTPSPTTSPTTSPSPTTSSTTDPSPTTSSTPTTPTPSETTAQPTSERVPS